MMGIFYHTNGRFATGVRKNYHQKTVKKPNKVGRKCQKMKDFCVKGQKIARFGGRYRVFLADVARGKVKTTKRKRIFYIFLLPFFAAPSLTKSREYGILFKVRKQQNIRLM